MRAHCCGGGKGEPRTVQLSDARAVISVVCNWLRVTARGIIYRVRTFCFVSGASTWVLELLVSLAPPGRIGIELVVPWTTVDNAMRTTDMGSEVRRPILVVHFE